MFLSDLVRLAKAVMTIKALQLCSGAQWTSHPPQEHKTRVRMVFSITMLLCIIDLLGIGPKF
jgi:hypothetical protein